MDVAKQGHIRTKLPSTQYQANIRIRAIPKNRNSLQFLGGFVFVAVNPTEFKLHRTTLDQLIKRGSYLKSIINRPYINYLPLL